MKKLTLKLLLITLFSLSFVNYADAQFRGRQALGFNFVIGTNNDYTNFGLGFKYQWEFVDNMRFEPNVTFFLKNDYRSAFDFTINYHYLFPLADSRFKLYPIAGLGFTRAKMDAEIHGERYEGSDTGVAFNFGGGAEFNVTSELALCFEYKYRFVNNDGDNNDFTEDWNRSHFTFGVAYKF
jgi:Opacity protein and related surface antigens